MTDLRQQAILGIPATSTVKATHRGAVRKSVLRKDARAYLATLVETDRLSRQAGALERSLSV